MLSNVTSHDACTRQLDHGAHGNLVLDVACVLGDHRLNEGAHVRLHRVAVVVDAHVVERQRAVERKNIVREHQRAGLQRKQAEQAVQLSKLKESRESKRQELDDDALSHLTAYSSLADEEQRLIASLQKWQSVQEEAFEQLDSVLGASRAASRGGSRPGSSTQGGGASPRALVPHPPPGAAPASSAAAS